MLFEEYNLETAMEVAREEALAEGKMAGITEGVKGSLDILMELHLPMTTIREKLVAKYPEQREMVEELLLHETKEEYTAEK